MNSRADFCRFLAACYYQPGAHLAEERVFDSMRAAAAAIDPRLAQATQDLAAAFAAEDAQALLIDYTRLFMRPEGALASPYASSWLRGEADVAAMYAEGGFEIAEDFRDRPDHVAVELEFLYLLHFAGEGRTGLRERFVKEHLAAWLAPFARAVAALARTRFYAALGRLTLCYAALEAGAAVRAAA